MVARYEDMGDGECKKIVLSVKKKMGSFDENVDSFAGLSLWIAGRGGIILLKMME